MAGVGGTLVELWEFENNFGCGVNFFLVINLEDHGNETFFWKQTIRSKFLLWYIMIGFPVTNKVWLDLLRRWLTKQKSRTDFVMIYVRGISAVTNIWVDGRRLNQKFYYKYYYFDVGTQHFENQYGITGVDWTQVEI